MCTVIYFPGKDGPLFSSCRDEDPARPAAILPQVYNGGSGSMLYPKDAAANGTWAGVHQNGHIIILLNGAFFKHKKKLVYKKSRGLIVGALLDTLKPLNKWKQVDLQNIEPFTLVLWANSRLYELVWDGNNKHKKNINIAQPYLWSSCTLYSPLVKQVRQLWFTQGIKQKTINTTKALYRFLILHNDAANGFVMKRNEKIKTLSISLIQEARQHFVFSYHDLLLKQETRVLLNKN